MAFPSSINDTYWVNLTIGAKDQEFLFDYLFENERPLSTEALVRALIKSRISREIKLEQAKQAKRGSVYMPKDQHEIGQSLIFPALDWMSGMVINSREGYNPEHAPFKVIGVELEDGTIQEFASQLEDHILNKPSPVANNTTDSDEERIMADFGEGIGLKLNEKLSAMDDLVRIGKDWFPKSILVDFTQGHLNIAEAILDMQGGGPIETKTLLKQIDIDISENPSLNEFSMNYALQEDPRFDEVGSKGVFSWFLHRLEPEAVQEIPMFLSYGSDQNVPVEFSAADRQLIASIDDELISIAIDEPTPSSIQTFTLNFPHWRVGSIPLTQKISHVFPSAFESERIKITLLDRDNDQEISAWVVRPFNYIYGLQKWYEDKELMPGSIINLEKSEDPGVIYIQAQKRRSNREWIKTVLVGADGGIVIALLKQPVSAGFAERMAISVPDPSALDEIWKERKIKPKSLKNDVMKMMQELSKLNQQRHVHFLELYSATNIIRRCPPEPLLKLLMSDPDFKHVGDYYFHLNDAG
jgi:hypothetical protein